MQKEGLTERKKSQKKNEAQKKKKKGIKLERLSESEKSKDKLIGWVGFTG